MRNQALAQAERKELEELRSTLLQMKGSMQKGGSINQRQTLDKGRTAGGRPKETIHETIVETTTHHHHGAPGASSSKNVFLHNMGAASSQKPMTPLDKLIKQRDELLATGTYSKEDDLIQDIESKIKEIRIKH